MLSYLIPLAVVGLIGYLALKHFAAAKPAVVVRAVQQIVGSVVLSGALGLMVRGSLFWALGFAMLGVWLLAGASLPTWMQRSGASGPGSGHMSRVATEHLEMVLDHGSGAMQGKILKGFFAGRRIEDLRPVELAHLWQDCRFADPQSAGLVEAYLDRIHPSWRDDLARAEADAPRGPDGRMTRAEALEILGLKDGASTDDIRRAHRDLMQRMHPDRGGSTYLAAKINEAKDVALS